MPSFPKINMSDELAAYKKIRQGKSKAGIKTWENQLKSAVLKNSLLLSHRSASESQCMREADAAQKELESYVSLFYFQVIISG